MKRAKAKLGFRNKTLTEKVAICRRFFHGVASVPAKKRNSVRLTALQSQLAAAEAELNALNVVRKEAIAQTARCHKKVKDLCRETTVGMLAYSSNAPTKSEFAAAGLDTIKPARAYLPPPTPENFRSVPTRDEGTVALRWKRSLRRSFFILEYTTDSRSATGWKQLRTICGTRTLITGLVSGQPCWFRLRPKPRRSKLLHRSAPRAGGVSWTRKHFNDAITSIQMPEGAADDFLLKMKQMVLTQEVVELGIENRSC